MDLKENFILIQKRFWNWWFFGELWDPLTYALLQWSESHRDWCWKNSALSCPLPFIPVSAVSGKELKVHPAMEIPSTCRTTVKSRMAVVTDYSYKDLETFYSEIFDYFFLILCSLESKLYSAVHGPNNVTYSLFLCSPQAQNVFWVFFLRNIF